jgi:hypothetical protein
MVRVDGVLDSELDGKSVLINAAGSHVVDLNPVGSLVWSGIDGQRELPDLVELVRAAVDDPDTVPPQQIATDVKAFLEELERLGLIRAKAGPPSG